MAGRRRSPKERSAAAWETSIDFAQPQAGQGFLDALQKRLRHIPRYATFSSFRRGKERQQQAAPVFETTRARGKQLAAAAGRSYRSPTPCEDDEDSMRLGCLSRCSNGTNMSDNIYTASTRAPSTEPPSRPGTRQEMRSENFEGVMEIQRQEVGEDKFADIVLREQRKQEYWDDYVEMDSPKKVISDFEELMRQVHTGVIAETGDDEILDSDLVNCSVGFTRRTPREELISSYAKQCRETYSVPLGPRERPNSNLSVNSPDRDITAAQLATPELLNYSGWSLGSERLNLLCDTSGKGMKNCRHCDLSGNRIQDRSVPLLCQRLLPTVETWNLSQNELSHSGARHLATGLYQCPKPPLLELNLENNRLGEAHEKDTCDFVDALESSCPKLRGLSLAQNQLGKVEAGLGRALGRMVAAMLQLKVLDLHWNDFNGLGAYHLLMGIYDNGQHGGHLSRLDLSWNRLGKLDDNHKNAIPAKVLADILEDHKRLFHLDISYNHLNEEACGYLAASIRLNHTLFGLHINGNDATTDAHGFLIPCKAPPSKRGGDLIDTTTLSFAHISKQYKEETFMEWHQTPKVMEQARSGGFQTPRGWKPRPGAMRKGSNLGARGFSIARRKVQSIVALRRSLNNETPVEQMESQQPHAIDLAAEIGSHPLDTIHLRAEHCWICDRWRQVVLTWTPGVSGNLPDAKVSQVFAFVSLDEFTRPIVMERKVKHYAKQNKTVPRWEGFLMVPPQSGETLPILVMFQVNRALEFAQDMTVRVLAEPTPVRPVNLESPQEMSDEHRLPAVNIVVANEIPTRTEKAVQLFEDHGIGMPLIVNEDLVEHGKVSVLPRTVIGSKAKPVERWTKVVSCFSSWREADEGIIRRMLDRDISLSKCSKFAGDDVNEDALAKAIAPFYPQIFTIYRILSVQGSGQGVFGVGLNTIVRLANECDMFDENVCSKHVANCAISASVVERKRQAEIKVRSDNSAIRYQFLETFLRLADLKYVRTGRAPGLVEAVPMLFGEMREHMDVFYSELQTFQKVFFVEEVDMVYRAYANLLHAIYDIYANMNVRNSAVGIGFISIASWYDFLQDCDAFDDRFVRRKAPQAFLLGMVWQIDEVTSDRHMHMSFVEFLVAIGAVVFMRQFWHEEEFADLIEEFCEDRLMPLLEEKGTQEHKDSVAAHGVGCEGGDGPNRLRSGNQPGRPVALANSELRKAFVTIFKMADEDDDGTLTLREFRSVFRNPTTIALLGGRGFKVEDFMQIFDTLDSNHNHVLTIDEAMAGFAAIRRLELTADRAKAFLNQMLSDADVDGDGDISAEEFRSVTRRLATQRKLLRLALDPTVVLNAFDTMRAEVEGKLDVDKLIEAIMKLRTPKQIPRWKIILKQIFQEADRDNSGTLSKEEFRSILHSQGTQAKFDRIGIAKIVLEGLFDVLDQDGSNDLTEEELVDGFQKLLNSGLARGTNGPNVSNDVQLSRKGTRKYKTEAAEAFAALARSTSTLEESSSTLGPLEKKKTLTLTPRRASDSSKITPGPKKLQARDHD